jgi:hydroxyacylglutathione hydrolase
MIKSSSLKFLEKKEISKDKLVNEYLGYSKMSGKELKQYVLNQKIYIIDTRDFAISATGYFPQSILCPTSMYSWLTVIVPSGSDVIIITDEDNYQKSIDALIDLKLYNLLGYGIYNEINESSSFFIQKIEYNPNTKESIKEIVDNGENIIDIREISEFKETGVIEQAILIPLTTFQTDYIKIPKNGNVYVFCKSGMRAVVGMSYAKRAGYTNRMVIMSGGMNKAIEEGYPLVPYPG